MVGLVGSGRKRSEILVGIGRKGRKRSALGAGGAFCRMRNYDDVIMICVASRWTKAISIHHKAPLGLQGKLWDVLLFSARRHLQAHLVSVRIRICLVQYEESAATPAPAQAAATAPALEHL